jgi:DNA-binding transcriptional ArsR family regulator
MTDTSHTAPARDVLDDAAEVFQLLSAPGRLHLLWVLSNEEVDVSTLVAAVGGTKAGISQHLAKLRLAGWINRRREGRRVLYKVVDAHIVTLVHQGVEHILELRAGRAPTSGGPSSSPRSTRTARQG